MRRQAKVDVLQGRGAALFCTYVRGCGALPTHRVRYRYPRYVITFGACGRHARGKRSRG